MFRHNGSKEVHFQDKDSPELSKSTGKSGLGLFGFQQPDQEESFAMECYLLNKKYFCTDAERFAERYREFFWITYCRRFKPLLVELRSHQGKEVKNLTSDNSWGCTIRCLQMLIANALKASKLQVAEDDLTRSSLKFLTEINPFSLSPPVSKEQLAAKFAVKRSAKILSLFNNDRRGSLAPFSI